MGKRRTHVTLESGVYDLAQLTMKLRRFEEFTGFIEVLIREEYERRFGPVVAPPVTPPMPLEAGIGGVILNENPVGRPPRKDVQR